MGEIVLHAGCPKAGSSTIQQWIKRHANDLMRTRDVQVVVAADRRRGDARKRVHVVPFRGGAVNSGLVIRRYKALDRSEKILDRFFGDLGEIAEQHAMTVISSEAFAQPFFEVDAAFLARLELLASEHRVRIAYYVRPQHTCLEAAWREWGYRMDATPSRYLVDYSSQLRYRDTFDAVARVAPKVSFEIRPFRGDLLRGSGPAADFAYEFLGVDTKTRVANHWVNRGIPLELANVLHHAPLELRGTDAFDRRASELQRIAEGWTTRESERIRRSRLVLQAYCHREFEPQNRELIERLRWPTTDFVPAVGPNTLGAWDLIELDELWTPDASEAELAILYTAIGALLTPR